MQTQNLPEPALRHHTSKIKGMLNDLITHLARRCDESARTQSTGTLWDYSRGIKRFNDGLHALRTTLGAGLEMIAVIVAHFFAGVFLANGVPHFVNGISGNPFQTPFASPPAIGESSPTINVLWGTANFVIGLWLLRVGEFELGLNSDMIAFSDHSWSPSLSLGILVAFVKILQLSDLRWIG